MERKHSRAGIFSFLAAIVSIAGIVSSIIVASVIAGNLRDNLGPVTPGTAPEGLGSLALVGGFMMLFTLTALGGAMLGLVGLFQKDRLKLFSVLGLVFNALLVGSLLIMVLFGMITGATLPGTFDS